MNKDRKLTGVFTKGKNVSLKVSSIFNSTSDETSTIFCYEVETDKKEENDQFILLTFFSNDYNRLKDNKMKPITLHRKQNNVMLTLNGMNRMMGSDNPEDNKDKTLDVSNYKDVLITKSDDGFSVKNVKLIRVFKRRNR